MIWEEENVTADGTEKYLQNKSPAFAGLLKSFNTCSQYKNKFLTDMKDSESILWKKDVQ